MKHIASTARSILAGLLASTLAAAALAANPTSAVVTTPQVRAELVAHAPDGLASGKPAWLGLKIGHADHWHTYWKNPGDSGLPTRLNWTLPGGMTAADIAWPTPQRLPLGPLMNFGYEGTLLLPVALTVPPGLTGDAVTVKLAAEWLVCKEVCIPESGEFSLQLPLRASITQHAALFDAAQRALPTAPPGAQATAAREGSDLVLSVRGLPEAWQGREIAFLPETAGVIVNAAQAQAQWKDGQWTARLPIDPQRTASPTSLPAVLTTAGQAAGLQLTFAVTTPWPPKAAPVAAPALGNAQIDAPAAAPPGLFAAIALALVGGLILNLMPCVFPVLSLKVLGFAKAGTDRRAQLAGGLAYTGGVVLSFVALAGLLLALRAGGEQLGWGFQLQQPVVVAALAALFTLIGLNLAGVFEFGSVLPSSWAGAQARHPVADHFLTGVLAVAVASPCTAPFMGASLGAAMTLPTVQALAVFAALGLGMALPYLAASAWPALARAMPRPGVWMQHFKTLMAFPMFATVVWLAWVLGVQAGIDAVVALLGLLVALAFVAWALGSPTLGPKARAGFGGVAVLLLVASLVWAAPSLRQDAVAAGQPAAASSDGWQAWTPERVAQARAEGRTVFVDFTAAWCVSCQFNKRTTLAAAEVKAAFERGNVLLLRADWTRRDPTITAELARFNRSGVPVYLVYTPGAPEPRLLSEILSVPEVVGAVGASS